MTTTTTPVERATRLPLSARAVTPATVDAILLGGHHWRRSALESVVPRPLLPVGQRPLLWYALRWLGAADIRSATVCTNGLSKATCDELGRQAAVSNVAYQEDRAPRGAAGCARDALAHTHSDQIVVLEGSVIPDLDLGRLLDAHAGSVAAVTIVVQPAGGRGVSRGPVPTGIYVFDRAALQLVSPSGFQDIKETLLPLLYRTGASMAIHEADGVCPRVGDATTYLRVNQWMIRRMARPGRHRPPFEPVERHGAGSEVIAHPSARIDAGACLIGPVLVGAMATIAANATIIGPASIGAHSRVAEDALVSRSVLWERSTVAAGASVDAAIIMHDGVVAAGEHLVDTVRAPAVAAALWPARLSRAIRRTLVRQRAPIGDVSTADLH